MIFKAGLSIVAVCIGALACGGSGTSGVGFDGGGTQWDANGDAQIGQPDSGGPCVVGELRCQDSSTELECQNSGGVPTWVATACDEYEYCIEDRCVPDCLDECVLGDTRSTAAGTQTCQLYSQDDGAVIAPGGGTHDLARSHLAWIRLHLLANGYLVDTLFSNNSYTTPIAHTGTVDSAEWTGVYLTSEALRFMATGSPDAQRNVEQIIERLHQLFEITATPGNMARIWAPLDGDPLLAAIYDSEDFSHFQTTYQGGPAFYHAWTSRDMYAGVSLGLGFAYDATRSWPHRQMIREVVVEVALELIKQRTDVPVTLRHHLFGSWEQSDLTYDIEHVILVPEEMVNGRVFIQFGSDEAPDDFNTSVLLGAREFVADFQPVLGQTPGLGSLVPSVPRPSSAMMLANFMELALHVTEGVPEYAADRAAIQSHYDANKAGWLTLMKLYEYHNDAECWNKYYGMTIAYHPLFSLLRLTTDASFKSQVQSQVLAQRLRPFSVGHANAYFDYIVASQAPAGTIGADELEATGAQLAGFRPPPKAAIAVNNTGSYSASPDCANQSTTPVAVGSRAPRDFLWQHHPFTLVNDQVDDRLVYPGADYLIGYWLGRYYGYLTDDAPNTCTRWAAN